MKPCPHCGKELPQEMQFCPYCMEKLMAEAPVGGVPVRRHRRWWLWAVLLIAVLLLLLCGLWLWRLWQPPSAPKKSVVASTGSSVTTTSAVVSTNPTQIETTATTTTTAQSSSTGHATAGTTTAGTTGVGTSTASPTATSGGTSTTAVCAAGHDWQSVTQTVHVDEVGHYETAAVEKQVTLFRCAVCYQAFDVLEDYYAHFDEEHDGDSLQSIFRDRYETVTEYREVQEQRWVVDTPAYDKTVTVGRRCRVCGETEDNQ